MSGESKIDSVKGCVSRIASEPQRAKRGDYLFRGLELSVTGGDEKAFIIVPEAISEFGRVDLYDFPLLCWEGAEIGAFGVELNNRLGDGTVIYTVTPETDLLLEPHRPVSVTDAVEAAACVHAIDLSYRVRPAEPFWMAKGRLIHTLFDHLLQSGPATSDKSFKKAFREARSAVLEILPGSNVSINDRTLEEEAVTHFDNLRRWLQEVGSRFDTALIEVDRMSTRWGLKGRADALLQTREKNVILELKTGRFAMEDHRLQVLGYSLLFEDADGGRPDGYLFYSALGRSENIPEGYRWSLLEGRNRVVGLKHSYIRPETAKFHPVPGENCPRRGKCFARSTCHRFYGNSSAGPQPFLQGPEKEYYDRWFRLLSLEAWESESSFARVLDKDTLAQRIEEGLTIPVSNMQALATDEGHDSAPPRGQGERKEGNGKPRYPRRMGRLHVDLVVGDLVAEVSPGDHVILHRGDAGAREALRATVIYSENGKIGVGISAPFDCSPLTACTDDASDQWFVDPIPFSRGPEVARKALFDFFLRADPGIVRLVVDSRTESRTEESLLTSPTSGEPADKRVSAGGETDVRSKLEDLCFAEGLTCELNEDQEGAIEAALTSEPFHLIHGPPGTGKTRVLARLIRIWLDQGERVLVACPTNIALDRLLISLIDLGVRDFIRVGSRSSVSPEFQEALERLGNPPRLLADLASTGIDFSGFRKRVGEVQLVGATAYQCAAHPIFLRQRFDRVVVDEAGQLDEPSSLAVLALAPRFVLGGDHFQLPPVVQAISPEPGGDRGLEQSMFERLFDSCDPSKISRLNMQYRMNLEIQEIPSRLFYEGTLVPSPEAATRRLTIDTGLLDDAALSSIIDPAAPAVFVDVEGSNTGKARPEEAAIASRILGTLLACGVPAAEIGIITPYRVQQALIREHLLERRGGLPATSINTVDRFQGGEREVIILSLARSDGVTSFLADRRRLNVSLSRARSKLILLGHGPILMEHPLFASLLEGLHRVAISPGT